MKYKFEQIQNYISSVNYSNTILLGDMNFAYTENSYYKAELLQNAGLQCILNSETGPIDQIWATEEIYNNSIIFNYNTRYQDYSSISSLFNKEIRELFPIASDHYPVVAFVGLDF